MTTALEKYAKLEAEARFHDGASAAPREVVLSFGERTLVVLGLDDRAVAHWPLASLRALGQPGDKAVQLVPDLASEERVVLDDGEMIAAIREVCPDLHRRPVNRRGARRALGWSIAALGSAALILLVLASAIADRLAGFVPPEREQALGNAVAARIAGLLSLDGSEPPGQCIGPEGAAALGRMTARVAPAGELPYPLRVSIVDHGMVNAVALPGGRVLIFRGLIDAAESPEEVAGVLAHEIGHVANRDPTRSVLRAAGTAGIIDLLLGDVFGASDIAAATDAVLNASYRRETEARADTAAYRLLGTAGLPTPPFAAFFERLETGQGDLAGPLKYLAGHPGPSGRAERAAAADLVGDRPFEPVLDDRAWIALGNICDEARAF